LRRLAVAAASLAAVVGVAAGYLASSLGQQNGMLLTFTALMVLGVGLVLRSRRLVTDAG
jgi:hypothetical protein